ncbi:oligosaccharide flippase family protein [Thermoproteota archaeon]
MIQRFINRIKPKSEFSKNVIKLTIGTSIAQAIPIAIAPILTRLYTPAEFGVLALFLAVTAIFGAVVTGRYDLAVVLPQDDEDAVNIVALSLLTSLVLSIVLFIVILIWGTDIARLLKNGDIYPWLYFIPVTVFSLGCYQAFNYWGTRKRAFTTLSAGMISKSGTLAVFQIGMGFLRAGSFGLILGQTIGSVAVAIFYWLRLFKWRVVKPYISWKRMWTIAVRYKNFPLFTSWSTLINTMSRYAINIVIAGLFSIYTVGLFAIVQRFLSMPMFLLGTAIQQVFFQEASKEMHAKGHIRVTFKSTFIKLICMCIPIFIIIYFSAEFLFGIVFGPEWVVAGTYAKILMPLFFLRFLSSTLSMTLTVYEKQRQGLVIQIIIFSVTMLTFLGASIYNLEFIGFLYLYTWVLFTCYLGFLIYYGVVVKFKYQKGKVEV